VSAVTDLLTAAAAIYRDLVAFGPFGELTVV
jgi:hypothetical protein